MEKLTITKQQARRFVLAHQGLLPASLPEGKPGILEYINRVGCIQFDPLNIVGHNPELVLQSRISDFRPVMLQELLYKDRKLLDGWDKMISIYRTDDWPYFKRYRELNLRSLGNSNRPATLVLPEIRKAISEQGPLSSINLNMNQTVNWSWAPTSLARAALESMYFWGELVIHHKVNTRKVYDFAHRHISGDLLSAPDPNKTGEQYHDWHVLRRIGGIGLLWGKSGDAWLGIPELKSKERNAALMRLLESGKIIEVNVEDISAPLYMRSVDKPHMNEAPDSNDIPAHASIIAPLDNLLWDRRLLKELFGLDYRWEVYKPVVERRYGYYVLPILYGDRFVARFEPGRDKSRNAFIIKNWWWEPEVSWPESMHSALACCFKRFVRYLGADSLHVDKKTIKQAGLEWLSQ